MDKEAIIEKCRDALWRVLDEHRLNEKNIKYDVTLQTAAAYFASTRMAMIAIETLHGINELSAADAGELIGEITATAETAVSIAKADQIEQRTRLIVENR